MATSLLDILNLAKCSPNIAQTAAKEVFAPYEPSKFPFLTKLYPLYGFNPNRRELESLPLHFSISCDPLSHFFIHHGGATRLGGALRLVNQQLNTPTDIQLYDLDKTVLRGQPNDSLVSIVIGRVPGWQHSSSLGTNPVHDSVYIYVECGDKRMAGLSFPIKGSVPISSDRPLLYLSAQFPQGTPISQRKPGGQVLVLVPHELNYR